MSLALIMGLGSKLTQETLATLLAELWVIRDGLSISIDLGINALIVKSDAKVAVDLLNNDSFCLALLIPPWWLIAGFFFPRFHRLRWFTLLGKPTLVLMLWLE